MDGLLSYAADPLVALHIDSKAKKKKEIKRQDNADSPGSSGTTKDVCNFEQ
jgi:hypothetical protein